MAKHRPTEYGFTFTGDPARALIARQTGKSLLRLLMQSANWQNLKQHTQRRQLDGVVYTVTKNFNLWHLHIDVPSGETIPVVFGYHGFWYVDSSQDVLLEFDQETRTWELYTPADSYGSGRYVTPFIVGTPAVIDSDCVGTQTTRVTRSTRAWSPANFIRAAWVHRDRVYVSGSAGGQPTAVYSRPHIVEGYLDNDAYDAVTAPDGWRFEASEGDENLDIYEGFTGNNAARVIRFDDGLVKHSGPATLVLPKEEISLGDLFDPILTTHTESLVTSDSTTGGSYVKNGTWSGGTDGPRTGDVRWISLPSREVLITMSYSGSVSAAYTITKIPRDPFTSGSDDTHTGNLRQEFNHTTTIAGLTFTLSDMLVTDTGINVCDPDTGNDYTALFEAVGTYGAVTIVTDAGACIYLKVEIDYAETQDGIIKEDYTAQVQVFDLDTEEILFDSGAYSLEYPFPEISDYFVDPFPTIAGSARVKVSGDTVQGWERPKPCTKVPFNNPCCLTEAQWDESSSYLSGVYATNALTRGFVSAVQANGGVRPLNTGRFLS